MDYGETLNTLEHLHQLAADGGDDSAYSPSQKRWISALHKSETGEPVRECGCKNKYTDAVLSLLLRLRKRGQLEEACKYRLRRGLLIWINNDCYSCHNLTDELAAEYLAAHPEDKDKFERIAEE